MPIQLTKVYADGGRRMLIDGMEICVNRNGLVQFMEDWLKGDDMVNRGIFTLDISGPYCHADYRWNPEADAFVKPLAQVEQTTWELTEHHILALARDGHWFYSAMGGIRWFDRAHSQAAEMFEGEAAQVIDSLILRGILVTVKGPDGWGPVVALAK